MYYLLRNYNFQKNAFNVSELPSYQSSHLLSLVSFELLKDSLKDTLEFFRHISWSLSATKIPPPPEKIDFSAALLTEYRSCSVLLHLAVYFGAKLIQDAGVVPWGVRVRERNSVKKFGRSTGREVFAHKRIRHSGCISELMHEARRTP